MEQGRQWLNITEVIFINFNVVMSMCECLAWREVKPGQSSGIFIVVNKRARQSPRTLSPHSHSPFFGYVRFHLLGIFAAGLNVWNKGNIRDNI